MKKNLIVLSILIFGLVAPVLVLAQGNLQSGGTAVQATCSNNVGTGTIETVICRIGSILNTIIPFLMVLGVLYFVWGVVSYVIGGDEEAKKKGRDKIVYGVIGLAVIVGVWGLVAILNRTFNPTVTGPVSVPCIVGTIGC